jgi:hypothetical protein
MAENLAGIHPESAPYLHGGVCCLLSIMVRRTSMKGTGAFTKNSAAEAGLQRKISKA